MINEEQQDEVFVAVHEGTCVGVCEVWGGGGGVCVCVCVCVRGDCLSCIKKTY